jgi:hypothetical protein
VKKMIPLLMLLAVFTVACKPNGSVNVSATVQQPVINTFTAAPKSISEGESSMLVWTVTGAQTVRLDQGIGYVALTGAKSVSPNATTTYILTATNSAGDVTAKAQVVVSEAATTTPIPAPSPVTTPTPVPTQEGLPVIDYFLIKGGRYGYDITTAIPFGGSTTLTWSVSNATSVIINPLIGTVNPTGSISVSPTATTRYTLVAINPYGIDWALVMVTVER